MKKKQHEGDNVVKTSISCKTAGVCLWCLMVFPKPTSTALPCLPPHHTHCHQIQPLPDGVSGLGRGEHIPVVEAYLAYDRG